MQNDISEKLGNNIFKKLDFKDFDSNELRKMLFKMLLIRIAEEKISENYTPCTFND